MAVSIIEQQPSNVTFPVGQDAIFVVSNQTAVATEVRVKFGVEVHISKGTPPNVSLSTNLVGTFKTTPNNAGVGIFNLRNIIENYVSADHILDDNALFMGFQAAFIDVGIPIHTVDLISKNTNSFVNMKLQFFVEYLGADANFPNDVNRATGTSVNSSNFKIFNSYLKPENLLQQSAFGFGTDYFDNFLLGSAISNGRLLTNAPFTQSCNVNDYMTIGVLCASPQQQNVFKRIEYFITKNDGTTFSINGDLEAANGWVDYPSGANNSHQYMAFIACGSANLQQLSTTYATAVTNGEIEGGKIEVRLSNDPTGSYIPVSKEYTINVDCPNLKGYEPIRLCWMNQYGAWDYYTFNLKNSRTINSKQTTYQQLKGTWNLAKYRLDGHNGGVKTFKKNAIEKIRLNTDYVSEDYVTIFEEMFVSPEIYLLKPKTSDTQPTTVFQQVEPVRITSKSFQKKTTVNDKLIQYTFDIDVSRKINTQTI